MLIVFSAVSLRWATEVLGPTQIGAMNLIMSLISFFGMAAAPVNLFYNRHIVEWSREGRLLENQRRLSQFLIGFAISISVLLLLSGAVFPGTNWPVGVKSITAIVAGFLVFPILAGANNQIFNLLGYRTHYVVFSNLAVWAGLVLAVIGTRLWGGWATVWMIGLLGGHGLSLLFSSLSISSILQDAWGRSETDRRAADFSLRQVFSFSWPLLVCTMLYWVPRDGYRLFMTSYASVQVIGLFSVAFGIGISIMVAFETFFREYYAPIFQAEIAHGTYEQKIVAWNNYADAYFPAIAITGFYVIGGRDFLINVLASKQFHSAVWLIATGVVAHVLVMIYAVYLDFSFAILDNRPAIFPNVLGAAVAICLLTMVGPHFPLAGTAFSVISAMAVIMLFTAVRIKRKHALMIPWKRIFKAVFLGVGLFALLEFAHYQIPVPSFAVSVIILFAAGLLLIAFQYYLARDWILKERNTS